MKTNLPTIAIDFDGVIHAYSKGWQGGRIYDDPLPGVAEAMQRLIDNGWRVVVHTARATTSQSRADVMEWLDLHDIPYFDVTAVKPLAVAYVDDRAIRFENWNQALSEIDRLMPRVED